MPLIGHRPIYSVECRTCDQWELIHIQQVLERLVQRLLETWVQVPQER